MLSPPNSTAKTMLPGSLNPKPWLLKVSLSSIPAPKRQRCEEQGAGVVRRGRASGLYGVGCLDGFPHLGSTRVYGPLRFRVFRGFGSLVSSFFCFGLTVKGFKGLSVSGVRLLGSLVVVIYDIYDVEVSGLGIVGCPRP